MLLYMKVDFNKYLLLLGKTACREVILRYLENDSTTSISISTVFVTKISFQDSARIA